jgi:signal transduction histidine kinase
MKIDSLASQSETLSQSATKVLDETKSLNEEISSEIRSLSHLLHPPLLDEVGLHCATVVHRWVHEAQPHRRKTRYAGNAGPHVTGGGNICVPGSSGGLD